MHSGSTRIGQALKGSISSVRLFAQISLILQPHKRNYMADQPIPEQQLNIELTEEMADGEYANLAIITHSFAEFVIDFVNVMPNVPKAKVKSRIVMTPQHAKRLMKALIDNVKRFEAQYGNIKDQEQTAMPFNFGAPTAQA
jgi:3-methyladenine DNA glycosylase Tag